MKLIAHRGWCEGPRENTGDAFARAAADQRVSGVELDVCCAPGSDMLLVSHDPPPSAGAALSLDDALTLLCPTRLELFVEIKQAGLAEGVAERLAAHGVAARSVVFAFPPVARSFPWRGPRSVRLGIIVEYPWHLPRAVRELAPDVLFLGWDARAWTRLAFRAWWTALSLERTAQRCGIPVVAGVVQRPGDLDWLARQGVHAAVADMDRLPAAGA